MDTATPSSWWGGNRAQVHTCCERLRATDRPVRQQCNRRRGIADGANASRKTGNARFMADLLGWNGYPKSPRQWLPAVQQGLKQLRAAAIQIRGAPASVVVSRTTLVITVALSSQPAIGPPAAGVIAAHTTWQRFANGELIQRVLRPKAARGRRLRRNSECKPRRVIWRAAWTLDRTRPNSFATSTSINRH